MRASLVSPDFALVRNASQRSRSSTRSIAMTYRHRTAYPGAVCPAAERSVLRDCRDALSRLVATSSYLNPPEESVGAVMKSSQQAAHDFKSHTLPQEAPKTLMARRPMKQAPPYGVDDVVSSTYTTQYRTELCRVPAPTDQFQVLPAPGRRLPPRPSSAALARGPCSRPCVATDATRPQSATSLRRPASADARRPATPSTTPAVSEPIIARGPALASAGAAARLNALHRTELAGVRLAQGRHTVRRSDQAAAAASRRRVAAEYRAAK
jgi:hypothetical protein